MEEKRKTHTSSAVKNRYNNKVYAHINVMLPKELVNEFKEQCKKRNVSQAQVIRDAVEKFLNEG